MPPINDDYQKLDRSPGALRRFGWTIAIPFLLLGGFLAWRGRPVGWPLIAIALAIVLLAQFAPARLQILHRLWMTLALAMGWVMTRVILTVVFLLVVTPLGLLQRLCGKRALDLAFRTGADSYWQTRAAEAPSPADYEKQF